MFLDSISHKHASMTPCAVNAHKSLSAELENSPALPDPSPWGEGGRHTIGTHIPLVKLIHMAMPHGKRQ